MTPAPLFLEPRSYRRRRLIDALRVVPVFGTLLFLLPLIWPPVPTEGVPLSVRVIYIFAVWLLLVAVIGVLSQRLHARLHARREGDVPEGDGADDGT